MKQTSIQAYMTRKQPCQNTPTSDREATQQPTETTTCGMKSDEWKEWERANERVYRQHMAARGILDPLPYSANWCYVYEDELGVSQYRWDNDECIGKFYPGIVRVALAQRLPDDLARLIFNDYFRHHLRECRHLGYEMHYRLKSVCRALHLDTRGNGLALKRRIFDELGVCTYTAKEYRSLLNKAVHYRRDDADGIRVLTTDQRDAMQLGEALRALNLWWHYPWEQTRRQRLPWGMS